MILQRFCRQEKIYHLKVSVGITRKCLGRRTKQASTPHEPIHKNLKLHCFIQLFFGGIAWN